MSPPSSLPVEKASVEKAPRRRLLARAEAVTLGGMVLVVSSLFFLWEKRLSDVPPALQAGALRVESLTVPLDGFGARVAAPLTICAVLCASTLLWDATEKNRMALGAAGGAGGLACVVIALTRFAPLPGILLALAGGALLLWGAIERASPPRNNA